MDISSFTPVNYLWQHLVERLGLDKAQSAARQALDLQSMHGDRGTLPVMIYETCGLALISVESLHHVIGFTLKNQSTLLLISTKNHTFQLLKQAY